eukprot:1430544-Amphidinium_carterae.1
MELGDDRTRECVHMTPVAPTHAQAVGIWKSEGHAWKQGKITLVIDLLLFAEETRAKVYQARTGVLLTKETIPWYCVVGWFERKGSQKIILNEDYGWFHAYMSEPQKERGSASEPSHAEPTEEENRVPREEARASRDCAAQPPTWDDED